MFFNFISKQSVQVQSCNDVVKQLFTNKDFTRILK